MNILHLLVSGNSGGIETLVRDYAKHSQHNNIFVFAWSGGRIADEMRENGADVIILNARQNGMRRTYSEIMSIIKEQRIEAVIAHHAAPLFKIILIVMHLFHPDIRTVAYAHSNSQGIINSSHHTSKTVNLQIQKLGFKSADNVIAISESVKNSLIELFGVRESRIQVIYNGVDTDKFRPSDAAGLSDSIQLIFVGRLVEEKGVQNILNALADASGLDFRLRIVGSGVYMAALEKQAQSLALADRVEFCGDRTDVPQLLALSDIFIHVPDCDEGFGITVIEAMAAGLTCICNRRGALPEIVEDGVNGYLVDAGDNMALSQVIKSVAAEYDSDKNKTIRANAIKTAQKFSIERFASELDRTIEDECGRKVNKR